MLTMIAMLAFAAAALATMAVFRRKDDMVAVRVRATTQREASREREMSGGLMPRVVTPAGGKAGALLTRLLPQNIVRSIERQLIMANEPMSLHAFLTLCAGMALLAGLVVVYVMLSRPGMAPLQLLGMCLAIVPVPVMSPFIILRRRVRSRQKRITRDLPDALDLLVTSVEAGLGVDAAFVVVTERFKGPVSETFSLYLRQVGLGRSRRQALAYAAERTGVQDLVRISTSVSQAEQMGATLGDVLRTQAEDLREARKRRAQEAAQKAPVLITIPLVFCFLPAMAAVVIVPSMLKFISFVGDLGGG
ncbi:MAG: type II secretion system F family protein [SAR202 cluster bacterium]|nr:type II secretion system F family protein [SAR202 cluster bacterium]